MKPDDKWIPYKDVRLLITCETFDEAKRRETKYTSTMCPTSEIESEDEGELWQKRRSSWDVRIWCCPLPPAPGPTAPGPTATGPTAPGPTATGPTAPGPTATGPTATGPTAPDPTAPGPTTTGPTAPGPTATGPIAPGPTAPGPTAPGPTAPGPTAPGPTATAMFPIQLPIANEDDFNEAESLLKNESVRQKMIARLALVGGTNSENLIRRMLATALTNALACRYN
ncbi:hypothetical protein KUCAC02_002640 [Chaenocephalus aceratus]|uniref:Uncharacterized protein n=1 Tax=Chaenocephalus aceratus TaxID=36190 RepID=A0ACB9XUW5_CHAAC|nr:hypothetical protein KUCAC02_002640 [Chaenocephalus aceratus]